jgi:hypothetical protein
MASSRLATRSRSMRRNSPFSRAFSSEGSSSEGSYHGHGRAALPYFSVHPLTGSAWHHGTWLCPLVRTAHRLLSVSHVLGIRPVVFCEPVAESVDFAPLSPRVHWHHTVLYAQQCSVIQLGTRSPLVTQLTVTRHRSGTRTVVRWFRRSDLIPVVYRLNLEIVPVCAYTYSYTYYLRAVEPFKWIASHT